MSLYMNCHGYVITCGLRMRPFDNARVTILEHQYFSPSR